MNKAASNYGLCRRLMDSVSEKTPISVEMLNTIIIISLAYVISASEKDEETLPFEHWIEVWDASRNIDMRDLLYDLIYSNVNADLHKSVDVLKVDVVPSAVAEIMRTLFCTKPSRNEIAELVNEIVDSYYPRVITNLAQEKIPLLCAVLSIRAYINGDVLTKPCFEKCGKHCYLLKIVI